MICQSTERSRIKEMVSQLPTLTVGSRCTTWIDVVKVNKVIVMVYNGGDGKIVTCTSEYDPSIGDYIVTSITEVTERDWSEWTVPPYVSPGYVDAYSHRIDRSREDTRSESTYWVSQGFQSGRPD